ncbi:MAG: hypothetical protein AB8G05_04890 [Oligoflexales bacterium]
MDKATKLANQAKASIDKFVDTVKLKTHLASMDSKSAWEKFESQFDHIRKDLNEFSEGVKQDSDEAQLQAHLALMNAKERWESLKEEMDHLVDTFGDKAEEKFDHAKVQMALAKLEAKELIDKNKHGTQFQKLDAEIKEDWYSFLSKLDDRIVDFINRFPLR